jgi:hypothetical protein
VMRKRLLAIAIAIAATALSGCAVHSFRTNGTSATVTRSAAIVLRYEPQMPQTMSMRTAGLGAVYNPSANDRLAARPTPWKWPSSCSAASRTSLRRSPVRAGSRS